MKLYKLNEHDWVAAPSLGEALAWYQSYYELDDSELIDEFFTPHAMTEEEMHNTIFVHDTGIKRTFGAEWEREQQRIDLDYPFLFASTEQ